MEVPPQDLDRSAGFRVHRVGHGVQGEAAEIARALVNELRLPRALTAFSIGGLLAIAGVLMQVLLRNPLADPYILGVSGGASFAALLGMTVGVSAAALPGLAWAGALASIVIVFSLARGEGPWSGTRLLLTGVVTASGWAALISLLLTLGPDGSLRGMLFWLIGDLSYARLSGWAPALLALVAGLLIGGFGVSRLRPTTVAAPVKIRPITFSGLDGGPAISPDGRMIAFRSERGQTPGIWIKQLDRGDAVRLTSGADGAARFSPDGTRILAIRSDARGTRLSLIDPRTGLLLEPPAAPPGPGRTVPAPPADRAAGCAWHC